MDKVKSPVTPRIEQRIEAQLHLTRQLKSAASGKPHPIAPFVTVSRQYGCDAMELAEQLAPRLTALEKITDGHWQVYNRQIVESIAREFHLTERLIEALDVRARSGMEEFMQTVFGQSPPDLKLLHGLMRTMRSLALHGRCIIVGRGGVVLTRGLPGGFHLRLVAPESWRMDSLIHRFGWSPAEARTRLLEEESSRMNFFQKYLGQDMSDPVNYDLVINVATTSREEQIGAVAAVFEKRLVANT